MNGLLSLLFATFLVQGDVLPEPMRGGPTIPATAPVLPSAPVMPSGSVLAEQPRPKVSVGWGHDPDGLFCMILQIAPDAIAAFAQGERGQELPVDIPPEIRDRIQRVIVRVGTAPVERNPPNPQSLSSTRSNINSPYLSNLDNRSTFDNRTPVTIDQPRMTDVLPTAGAGQLNGYSSGQPPASSSVGMAVPPSMGNSAVPNLGPNNNWDTTGRDVLPPTNVGANDRFQPLNPTKTPSSLDFFKGSANSASNGYGANQGNYGSANPGNYGNANLGNGGNSSTQYTNPNNPAWSNRAGSNAYVATNPNGPPVQTNYNDPAFSNGHQPNYQVPQYQQGNLLQAPPVQQYNVPQTQQPSQYSLPGSQTHLASANTIPYYRNSTTLPLPSNDLANAQLPPKNTLLPFLLLFSIVGNVYLGLWMGHLRNRYRQLLSNMRGVPVADLDD
jgi:hypothetical protein